jgi:hypothetical protein
MNNFTPDEFFKEGFKQGGPVVANEAIWQKLEAQLLEDAALRKEKKKRRAVFVFSSLGLLLVSGSLWLAVGKSKNDNHQSNNIVSSKKQIKNAGTNNSTNNIENNNANNNSSTPSIANNNNIAPSIGNTNIESAYINPNIGLFKNINNFNALGNNNNNDEFAISNRELSATENNTSGLNDATNFNSRQIDNVNEKNYSSDLNTLINNQKLVSLSNSSKAAIKLPKHHKVSLNGFSIAAQALKSNGTNTGFNIAIAHEKRINNNTSITTGIGFMNLPTTYNYKKVLPKEGFPTELEATLYDINLAYMQIGVQLYPKKLNKTKQNFGINITAMPGVVTDLSTSTNTGGPDLNYKMRRQINRMHFATSLGVQKRVAGNLWAEAGGTYSFSTLTNAIFLNKTNKLNNITFLQAGLKYKF